MKILIVTGRFGMGHYSAAFTLDRYGHVTGTMRRGGRGRRGSPLSRISGNRLSLL